MLVVPFATARDSRHLNVLANGARTWLTHFVGEHVLKGRASPVTGEGSAAASFRDRNGIYPMAHLVEQEAGSEVGAHFHRPAQFQMFVAGEGHLGRHFVRPVTIQFAAPFSPYGPIRAGATGLHYFTLRNGWDPGARWMPASRAELERLRPRVGHSLYAEPFEPMSAEALRRIETPTSTELLQGKHGLCVHVHRVPPGASWLGTDPSSGRGQFRIVTGGAASICDDAGHRHALTSMSCMFLEPTDDSGRMDASESGLEIVVLQFPNEQYFTTRHPGQPAS